MKIEPNKPKIIPRIGRQIYVPTTYMANNGKIDLLGGIAIISFIEKYPDGSFLFMVEEHGEEKYVWEYINDDLFQKHCKNLFGNRKAYVNYSKNIYEMD